MALAVGKLPDPLAAGIDSTASVLEPYGAGMPPMVPNADPTEVQPPIA